MKTPDLKVCVQCGNPFSGDGAICGACDIRNLNEGTDTSETIQPGDEPYRADEIGNLE